MSPPVSIEVQVVQLFATPVVIVHVPDAAALNAALKDTILKRAEAAPSTDHSNLGGWQSDWDMMDWGGPATAKVLDLAKQTAGRMTQTRAGQPTNIEWAHNIWANVNRYGNANEGHIHPGSVWSGTYWVETGGAEADPTLGGEFELYDPRGAAPAMLAPDLVPAVPGAVSMGASEMIPPRAGDMLLFPSWVRHAVRPYRGDQVRISIAFNFWPATAPRPTR